jgi:hypothetical protein
MCVLNNLKSLHKHKINHLPPCKHLHQPNMRIKLKMMKIKIKKMSHLERRAMIKGEMVMIKTRKMMRVQDRQAIQRDHPMNTILSDIHKGVTTRSRVAHFCEHYSFVSSIEPHRVEEALQDSDWVVAMQEELNNFTRNEVWYLVPRPNQNVVGTKWVFRNKQDEHGVVTRNKARLVAKGYS